MERFLERAAVSKYKKHFILKGGALISNIFGLQSRTTFDIDTTLKNILFSLETVRQMTNEIIAIAMPDCIVFTIDSMTEIREDAEYPGIRVKMTANLISMKIPLKIDYTTIDSITPSEMEYEYQLMFEDRTITLLSYNFETILAEKLETIISKSTANSRMRDFYDIAIFLLLKEDEISIEKLQMAILSTAETRKTLQIMQDGNNVIELIRTDENMKKLWHNYQIKYEYAFSYDWEVIMTSVSCLYQKAWISQTKNTDENSKS